MGSGDPGAHLWEEYARIPFHPRHDGRKNIFYLLALQGGADSKGFSRGFSNVLYLGQGPRVLRLYRRKDVVSFRAFRPILLGEMSSQFEFMVIRTPEGLITKFYGILYV